MTVHWAWTSFLQKTRTSFFNFGQLSSSSKPSTLLFEANSTLRHCLRYERLDSICLYFLISVSVKPLRCSYIYIISTITCTDVVWRDTVCFGSALTCTLVFSLWKKFTQPKIKVRLESSQFFAWFSMFSWKTCFWVCFWSSYNVVFIIFG